MQISGETFLILANAEWDWPNRVNCHHVAARLAQNNRVVFMDTIGGRTPAPREFKKVWRRLKRIVGGVRKINDNLTVLSPFVIPVYGNERMRELNTTLLAMQIRHALPRNSKPIVWFYLPSLVGLVGRLKERLVIYHCVDEHAANPNVPASQVREWERRLLQSSDAVFTTASTLYEDKRKFNSNTYYFPNVGDADVFARVRDSSLEMAEDMRSIPRPIAGFIGNITAYKVNLDLLFNVAQRKPDWSFVLIGPVGRGDPSTDVTRLQTLKNIFLLGERSYAELPSYAKAFDVCMIPFNLNESTRGTLPMKFFEYLATGKPVVSTSLPSLTEFRDFFYSVDNTEGWMQALQNAIGEDATRAKARMALSKKYSWDARMIEIDTIIADLLTHTGLGRSR